MINLDEKYQSYLENPNKGLTIDGVKEKVKGFGYVDDGKTITGYYVKTDNYKLFYNNNEQFLKMEALRTQEVICHI